MTPIPGWAERREALTALIAQPRFGIIADFDGTLSPFVSQPDQAAISTENAQALEALAPLVTVLALVSGRTAADLHGRFPRPWLHYYGNHGLERWVDGAVTVAEAARPWADRIQAIAAAVQAQVGPDIGVEDKGVTLTVHYRRALDPDAARRQLEAILRPLAEREGLHLSEGQFIWEVKPPIAIDKGTAAAEIVDAFRLDAVIFLGDDVTDFAAMRRLRALRAQPERHLHALSVGVVHPNTRPELYTVCDLSADGVDDTARLLHWIGEQRTAFFDPQ